MKEETWKEQTPKSENVQKQSPTRPKDQHEQFTMVYLGSDPNLEAQTFGSCGGINCQEKDSIGKSCQDDPSQGVFIWWNV